MANLLIGFCFANKLDLGCPWPGHRSEPGCTGTLQRHLAFASLSAVTPGINHSKSGKWISPKTVVLLTIFAVFQLLQYINLAVEQTQFFQRSKMFKPSLPYGNSIDFTVDLGNFYMTLPCSIVQWSLTNEQMIVLLTISGPGIRCRYLIILVII